MRVVFTAVAMVVLLVPSSAYADVERIALRYEASEACPSESRFLASVGAHTKRWSRVPEGTPDARTIRVGLTAGRLQSVGKLVISIPGGELSEREIIGPNCAEVSEAVAVMVALAIDPSAGMGGTPTEDEGARQDSIVAPSSEAPPRAETHPRAPLPTDQASAASRPQRSAPQRSPRQAISKERPRVSFDLRLEVTSAVVRGALQGIGTSMAIEAPPLAELPWLGAWKPSIAVGFRQSLSKERTVRSGSADILWTAGNLRVCPLQVAIRGERVRLSPCAETNIGVLRASSSGFVEARSVSVLWLDFGGALWASVALSKRFFFSSTVLVTLPTNRQPFILKSGVSVAGVPPLGVLVGVGLGAAM